MLNTLALLCAVFTIWFTWRAIMLSADHRAAMHESWVNLGIGFTVNFIANILILPFVGGHISVGENFALGSIYTAISVARSYSIRRWFSVRQQTT